jgi:outer membrane protein assembly factor BamA
MFVLYNFFKIGEYKDLWFEHVSDNGNNKIIVYTEKYPEVTKINISGISKLDKALIDSLFNPLLGKAYNSKVLLKKTLKLLQSYRKIGYSLAEVEKVVLMPKTRNLLQIKEGKINKIIIEGNDQIM